MVTKRFGVDFDSEGGALTLPAEDVTDTDAISGMHERTHPEGWTISGEIQEDYYVWVSEFEATHPVYGRVWGAFQDEVYADSEEGFQHFMEHHPPQEWEYGDI